VVTPLLVAESVGKRFGERKVLASAYLQAGEGRVAGLLGRNGEGKSTLLKICAGVMRPDHGTVRFAGRMHPVARLHRLAREGLFFLPAERTLLDPGRTLRQHLELVARQLGRDSSAWAVESTGTAEHLDTPCARLSGGERRLAELAVALAARPRCLLADEPLRGLDPRHAERVGGVLRALAGEGCAVVVTGHELGFLFPALDDVLWLNGGTTRLFASPAEARGDWRFRREFLGVR
jgi:ABC-type multidrug transport system ATPase subunit